MLDEDLTSTTLLE